MGKKKQNKGKAGKDSSDLEKPQPYLYHELFQSEGLNPQAPLTPHPIQHSLLTPKFANPSPPPKVQNEKIIEEILEKMK